MLKLDGAVLLTSAITKTSDNLIENVNFNKVIEEEMRKLDIIEEESKGIGECKQFVISKNILIQELTIDNNKEIYLIKIMMILAMKLWKILKVVRVLLKMMFL